MDFQAVNQSNQNQWCVNSESEIYKIVRGTRWPWWEFALAEFSLWLRHFQSKECVKIHIQYIKNMQLIKVHFVLQLSMLI